MMMMTCSEATDPPRIKSIVLLLQTNMLWSQEKWQTVHFGDESKFLLIGSDGKTYVRRKVGEELSPKCLKASVKFGGGSAMVWGVISGDGVGPLAQLQRKVNAGVYKQDHVWPATFHIHARQCPMSQGYGSHELPQGRKCYCYGLASSKPRSWSYWECVEDSRRTF